MLAYLARAVIHYSRANGASEFKEVMHLALCRHLMDQTFITL